LFDALDNVRVEQNTNEGNMDEDEGGTGIDPDLIHCIRS
jgi:hypothetical protein